MKNLLYLILIFLLPNFIVAQQNNSKESVKKESANFKNQIDLDLEIFGASLAYKKKVYKNWFIGGGLGGGLIITKSHSKFRYSDPLGYSSFVPSYIESFHIELGVKYSFKDYLTMEFGPRYSTFGEELGTGLGISNVSLYSSMYLGFKHVQIGVKIMFLNVKPDNYPKESHTSSLIILRLPLKRWN